MKNVGFLLYILPKNVYTWGMVMQTVFRETTYSNTGSNVEIDVAAGVMKNVKIWGLKSDNGYEYTTDILRESLKLCDNSLVCVDHNIDPHNPNKFTPRKMPEVFGVIKTPYIDANGEMRAGEFKWNTKHAFHESFIWWAQNAPDKIGFSVTAAGSLKKDNGKLYAANISKVQSFDIVTHPATCTLREQTMTDSTGTATVITPTLEQQLGELAKVIVADQSMDKATKKTKLVQLLKMLGEDEAATVVDSSVTTTAGEEEVMTESTKFKGNKLVAALTNIVAAKNIELKDIKLTEQTKERMLKAESKLPKEAITAPVKDKIVNAKDDAEVDVILTEQVRFIETITGKPIVLNRNSATSTLPDVSKRTSTGNKVEKYDNKKLKEEADKVFSS